MFLRPGCVVGFVISNPLCLAAECIYPSSCLTFPRNSARSVVASVKIIFLPSHKEGKSENSSWILFTFSIILFYFFAFADNKNQWGHSHPGKQSNLNKSSVICSAQHQRWNYRVFNFLCNEMGTTTANNAFRPGSFLFTLLCLSPHSLRHFPSLLPFPTWIYLLICTAAPAGIQSTRQRNYTMIP